MRTLAKLVAMMIAVAPALASVDAAADAPAPYDAALQATHDKVDALRGLGSTLQRASEEPAPPKLTPEQLAEVKKYDAWLRTASERVLKLAASWDQRVDAIRTACLKEASCNKVASAKAVTETNMSFNLQY